MSDIILDILRRYVDGTKIKKASARSGGEYHSPCPKCGGTDRFCLFPEQPGGALAMQHGITGTWACPRHCQEGGDAIDLLTWAGGLTFREACEELRIDLPERTQEERRRYRPLRPLTAHGTDTWTPTSYAPPPEAWLTQATKLATEAHARLLETPSILSYLAKRGLPLEAVQRYGLGYIEGEDNTGKYLYRQRAAFGLPPKERDGKPVRALRIPRGITIPCWSDDGHTQALRVRIRKRNADLAEGEDKYILIAQPAPPYSAPLRLAPIGVAPELATWAVAESELDAMLIHHACGGKIGALAILTASGKPDAVAHAALSTAARILLVMDWDAKPDGDIPTASNWRWWRDRYPQARLWPVPAGKDPGEAFAKGVDIREWLRGGCPASCPLTAPESGPQPQAQPEPEPMGALPDGTVAAEGEDSLILPDYLERRDIPADVLTLARIWRGKPIRFVRDGNGGWEWRYNHRWAAAHPDDMQAFMSFQSESAAIWDWLSGHRDYEITSRNFLFIWG